MLRNNVLLILKIKIIKSIWIYFSGQILIILFFQVILIIILEWLILHLSRIKRVKWRSSGCCCRRIISMFIFMFILIWLIDFIICRSIYVLSKICIFRLLFIFIHHMCRQLLLLVEWIIHRRMILHHIFTILFIPHTWLINEFILLLWILMLALNIYIIIVQAIYWLLF